jgi:hypothetical protein
LFLVAGLAAVVAGEFLPRRRLPQSVAEALARLQEGGVNYHVVSVMQQNRVPDCGVYLCERPQSWESLNRLPRGGAAGSRWQGVVHLERCPNEETAGFCLQEWGPYGARVGGLFFFGDPAMVGRIRAALEP